MQPSDQRQAVVQPRTLARRQVHWRSEAVQRRLELTGHLPDARLEHVDGLIERSGQQFVQRERRIDDRPMPLELGDDLLRILTRRDADVLGVADLVEAGVDEP